MCDTIWKITLAHPQGPKVLFCATYFWDTDEKYWFTENARAPDSNPEEGRLEPTYCELAPIMQWSVDYVAESIEKPPWWDKEKEDAETESLPGSERPQRDAAVSDTFSLGPRAPDPLAVGSELYTG